MQFGRAPSRTVIHEAGIWARVAFAGRHFYVCPGPELSCDPVLVICVWEGKRCRGPTSAEALGCTLPAATRDLHLEASRQPRRTYCTPTACVLQLVLQSPSSRKAGTVTLCLTGFWGLGAGLCRNSPLKMGASEGRV
ncbi:hypothetical protein NDU88_003624 [Pleurodeles waltl]|uniref:Uncharacterized protein n=1 Tax=Pleurodeles waltl TaxID=8319 RepID=A0AAV7VEQ1_PLEWA|nr:hypothetical protein NDU88_003624 [Pleurodeles waltl]